MKVVKRKIKLHWAEPMSLYVVKDDKKYIAFFDKFSWSNCFKNSDEVEKGMKYENAFQSSKHDVIVAIINMIEQLKTK